MNSASLISEASQGSSGAQCATQEMPRGLCRNESSPSSAMRQGPWGRTSVPRTGAAEPCGLPGGLAPNFVLTESLSSCSLLHLRPELGVWSGKQA